MAVRNIFDGSEEDVTFGQALCEMVQRVSWQTEGHARAALRAVQTEFNMLPPEVPVEQRFQDARDITLHNQDRQLARQEAELEKMRKRLSELEDAATKP